MGVYSGNIKNFGCLESFSNSFFGVYSSSFGMLMPLKNSSESGGYRYGYNGMQKDDEIKGQGNSYDFGARMYDPRVGRWWGLDKAFKEYPESSPYSYGLNSPILYKDKDGNVIVDPKGNVVFVKLGTMMAEHPGAPGKQYEVNFGFIFANDGTPILAYQDVKKQLKGANTDCHGVTFAKGHVWIDNNQVPALLKGDGYTEQNYKDRKWGDPVVYTDNKGMVEDSKKVCENHDIVYGQGGLESKNTYKNIDEAWTDPKETKEAHIFHGNGNVTYDASQIQNLETNTVTDPNLQNVLQNASARSEKLPESNKEVHIVPANP